MKRAVYKFKQAVLGLSFFHSFEEKEYEGRKEIFNEDKNGTKVVLTSIEDMTFFEHCILGEYEEDECSYKPTLTGDLF